MEEVIVNRQCRLAARPVGRIKASDFAWSQAPVPKPGPNQFLVRNLYLSLDPTHRIWMSDMDQYMPPVQIGDVMRGTTVGRVVHSNSRAYAVGDLVLGLFGWQDYAIGDPTSFIPPAVLPKLPLPPTVMLGALGMTGMTAYFGLLDIGRPLPGQTVVISAAAGAVGSIAGQIAKMKGCRVVGIAGSEEKCAWVRSLGFDAAVNYHDTHWREQLRASCPGGVDVDFENVGGEVLDAVLEIINLKARIVICGLIASYNATAPVPGPYHFSALLMKRARAEGFLIIDYVARFGEAMRELAGWVLEGKLQHRETIVAGLENAPAAVNQLFDGKNIGKLIVKIADA